MEIRNARPSDYERVIPLVDEWWGGRHMRDMLPRLFFVHFAETSYVAEEGGELAGFLCGFFSQTFTNEAYIHFVGVNPAFRRHGVGRMLYERFFAVVAGEGRSVVRCVTSPVNARSIAFHLGMGFAIEPGDELVEGISVHRDYDGPGEPRVVFVKRLY